MYFTKERVDITKRVEEGKTTLFIGLSLETQQEAEKLAKQKRSYIYDAYTDNEFDKRVMVGYAVPN
ncbi:MAG: hypothetical protein V3V28_09085 [Polaribacter sp.]|uniref:hypothetical protein n=1 Tax=Polaribacter sp. TaxID=1920175 RepID=UPI002307BD07|nr:hypothetical protein [Tenacibaculum maritimum]MDB0602316.1 hypothetical protein [Tenacibaculum maritimum]MDB0612452.1 hypothetical protein [Tenacibaculum maritimum]